MADRAEASAMPTGRCDSLEAILGETGLTVSADEIAAYMHDEVSRGGNDPAKVLSRILEGRYGLEFYDERQEAAFHEHFTALWNRVKREFDPAHDQKIAPLRSRILAMLDSQVAWLRECDRQEISPIDLPQEDSVHLASIGGILSQVLDMLHRDKGAPVKEIRKMEETIGMIEQDSEQVLTRLSAAIDPDTPPQLELWRPDDTPTAPEVYQLRIDIADIRPPIWRRILVMNTTTLAELHTIIQNAMDWDNAHLHSFEIHGLSYGPMEDEDPFDLSGPDSITDIPLHAVIGREGSTFTYTYDFGDSWKHKIKLEKILPVDKTAIYPRCIKGKRACPPEDCGGPWAYEGLLEALSDPTHPSHRDLTEWLEEDFDPEAFDLTAINTRLARLPFSTKG
ncbi:MAG: plasmid pRiA4b ORF-3 family protein [Kiritimatiellia bacterium]|nr:plasmid pRiA4b ORF-3 family protein [Kiritimatiellia bacterium]